MKISVNFYCLDKFVKIIITQVCRMVTKTATKSVANPLQNPLHGWEIRINDVSPAAI